MKRLSFFRQLMALPVIVLLLVPAAMSQLTGTVDFTSTQQQIDGFGLNATFGRGGVIDSASGNIPAQVADLLYNPVSGAGLSILRMGIDTDLVIVPTAPASCSETPTYTWDHNDGGEIWMGQQAVKYGVKRYYADSWGAPGYMKTNNNINNGGVVCDGTSSTQGSGSHCLAAGFSDCRAAYSNYLVQFVKDYLSDGIPITDLGWVNEPNANASYASMQPTSAQAITFLDAYGPIVRNSGLNVNLICCDYYGWTNANKYNTAIVNDPTANSFVDLYSAHEYGGVATFQLTTAPTGQPIKHNWMSEYGPQSPVAWNPYWDKVYAGTSNNYNDGMWLANDISNALNKGKIDAYIYWYPASTSTTGAMIQMGATSAATSFIVSARLNSFAHFARFVHPGAYQVTMATSSPSCTNITGGVGNCIVPTAFVNPDGTKVINVVNNYTTSQSLSLTLDAASANWVPTAYVTDGTLTGDSAYPTYPQPPMTSTVALTPGVATVSGTTLSATFTPRSMTTIVLAPPAVAGTVQLIVTSSLFAEGDGTFLGTITIRNTGSGTAQNVQLSSATLGGVAGSTLPTAPLPYTVGDIAPGSYQVLNVNFPAGPTPGSVVIEKLAGTYSGGTFGGSLRTTVPSVPSNN
jgi:glucuronoarabinoxylan endo-1,4-beta-xylanase